MAIISLMIPVSRYPLTESLNCSKITNEKDMLMWPVWNIMRIRGHFNFSSDILVPFFPHDIRFEKAISNKTISA